MFIDWKALLNVALDRVGQTEIFLFLSQLYNEVNIDKAGVMVDGKVEIICTYYFITVYSYMNKITMNSALEGGLSD